MVWESFYDTQQSDKVQLHFALDDDDPTARKYPMGWAKYPSHNAVEALNAAFFRTVVPAKVPYVGAVCDEQRFITPGWDLKVLDALEEMGGGLVFPNDLINPGTMPACPIISTKICEAVEYFAHPAMTTNYYDNVWKDLGLGVEKMRYLDDVVVQHLSMPHSRDNSMDIAKDRDTYILWSRWFRPAEVAKARAALGMS